MPFGLIGDVVGAVFGGGSADAEANNDVVVDVTTAPVINIDSAGFAAGNLEAATALGGGLKKGLMSFGSTLAFTAIAVTAAVVIGRR